MAFLLYLTDCLGYGLIVGLKVNSKSRGKIKKSFQEIRPKLGLNFPGYCPMLQVKVELKSRGLHDPHAVKLKVIRRWNHDDQSGGCTYRFAAFGDSLLRKRGTAD
jgi:hypothetical protein